MHHRVALWVAGLAIIALTFARASLASADQPDPPNVALSEVFKAFSVKAPAHFQVSTEIDPDFGCEPLYYLLLRYPVTYEGQPYVLELDLQTLTAAQLKRISISIRDHQAKRGLPQCALNDRYALDDYVIDLTQRIIRVPVAFKGNHGGCYAESFHLPYTDCVRVEDLYPSESETPREQLASPAQLKPLAQSKPAAPALPQVE